MSPPSEFGNEKDIIHVFRKTSQPRTKLTLDHEDTGTLTPLTPLTHNEAEIPNVYENDNVYVYFGNAALYEGGKIAAVLPVISAVIQVMYDFEITFYDDVQKGEELICISNFSEPSEYDEIAEFYDDT